MLHTGDAEESPVLSLSGRELLEREKDVVEFSGQIMYSRRYYDEEFEYR